MGNTHPQVHTDINGKPWGTSPELTSVCTPRHCPNLYLAQTQPVRYMALLSLAYLIKKSSGTLDSGRKGELSYKWDSF